MFFFTKFIKNSIIVILLIVISHSTSISKDNVTKTDCEVYKENLELLLVCLEGILYDHHKNSNYIKKYLDQIYGMVLLHPKEQIIESLKNNYAMIPQDRETHLPLKFHDDKGILFLGKKNIFATYENGHFGGAGIFQYNVSDSGKITWEVIHTITDGTWLL